MRKGFRGGCKIAKKTQCFTLEPRLVRKGWRRTKQTRKKTTVNSQKSLSFWHSNLISCERVAISWRGQESQREREREREREPEREREREREAVWRCEDVKMYSRPPLLEEPFAQTLSEIINYTSWLIGFPILWGPSWSPVNQVVSYPL